MASRTEKDDTNIEVMCDETPSTLTNAASMSYLDDMIRGAQEAAEREKQMTIWHAIKTYRKAVLYSMVLSCCLVMEGYDMSLTSNFFALPQFRRRFGSPTGNGGDYQLSAQWMAGLQNGTQIGQILGLMIAGLLADRFGYKKTLIEALICLIAFIFLFFFATHIAMLFAAGVLCGIPWGAFQTLTTTYAADVTPIRLRPILTSFVNMCWVVGQIISPVVMRSLLHREDDWAWRVPYAIQWVFPPVIILGAMFAPESPTWLVRHGRLDDARKSLRRLSSKLSTDEDIERTLAMIVYTDKMEKEVNEGTSYLDCFKGTNRRRTGITCMVWVTQVTCGMFFGSNVTYFLQQAGFSPDRAFDFGIGMRCLAFAGTICAWFLLPRVGRRTLYLWGQFVMLLCLLAVGCMGIPASSESLGWASGAFMMLFVATYDVTVGPTCYALVAEIPNTRLNIKTVVLARNAYNIAGLAGNFLNAPILNPTAWNLRGKGGFIWAGFNLVTLVWMYFYLPETKDRALGELDVLFEERVSARKFSKTSIDAFRRDLIGAPQKR